jgi:hypothetical protein
MFMPRQAGSTRNAISQLLEKRQNYREQIAVQEKKRRFKRKAPRLFRVFHGFVCTLSSRF